MKTSSALPAAQALHIQRQDQVLTIKINRPEVYNALNTQTKAELQQAITWAGQQSELRVVVLGAEGKAFCTGQDLNDRASTQTQGGSVDLGHTLESEWNPLVKAIYHSPIPVIAAVQGVTAGAGISVALACDLIIAAPEIKFVSGFAKLGLCPDAGSTHALTRALGKARAYEFFIFNQPLMSEELEKVGLINEIHHDPWSAALAMAQELAKLAPLSAREIKHNMQLAQHHSWDDMLQLEVDAQRRLGHSQDYQEGVKAFFEKRPPRFQGK